MVLRFTRPTRNPRREQCGGGVARCKDSPVWTLLPLVDSVRKISSIYCDALLQCVSFKSQTNIQLWKHACCTTTWASAVSQLPSYCSRPQQLVIVASSRLLQQSSPATYEQRM